MEIENLKTFFILIISAVLAMGVLGEVVINENLNRIATALENNHTKNTGDY